MTLTQEDLKAIQGLFTEQFQSIDKRFDSVDERLDRMEGCQNQVEILKAIKALDMKVDCVYNLALENWALVNWKEILVKGQAL